MSREEEKLFNRLYSENSEKIRKYLEILCRDPDTAEDLMQETFLRVQKSYHTYDPGKGSFLPWARTIARNLCIRLSTGKFSRETASSDSLDRTPDLRDDPADQLEKEFLLNQLNRALSCLPEREKRIVIYRYRDGMRVDEIAEILKVSRKTVSRGFQKAMSLLRQELSQDVSDTGM